MEEEKKTLEAESQNTVEADEKDQVLGMLNGFIDELGKKADKAKKYEAFRKQMGFALTLYGQVLTNDMLLRGVLEFLNSALSEALKASQAIVDEMKEKGETGWN